MSFLRVDSLEEVFLGGDEDRDGRELDGGAEGFDDGVDDLPAEVGRRRGTAFAEGTVAYAYDGEFGGHGSEGEGEGRRAEEGKAMQRARHQFGGIESVDG